MSWDLEDFALLKYYNATPTEIIDFLNKYSLRDIKTHLKFITTLEEFDNFFYRYKEINPNYIENIDNLKYLHMYRKYLKKWYL